MKQISRIILPLAICFAMASCSKENTSDLENIPGGIKENLKTVTLGAVLDDSATKLTLSYSEDNPGVSGSAELQWQAGDRIAVWDGKGIREFTLATGEGTKSGTFTGDVDMDAVEFCAVYPYAAGITWDGENSRFAGVTVPSAQNIAAGGCVDRNAVVCVADTKASTANLMFRSVVKLIAVDLQQADCTSFRFRGNDGCGVAGTIAVTPAGTVTVTSAEDAVTVTPEDGTGHLYFFTVVPQQFAAGFSVIPLKSGSRACRFSDKASDLSSTGGLHLGTISGLTWVPDVIMTKADLDAWAAVAGHAYTTADTVSLGADIDYESGYWTPVEYRGSFDGDGHALTNIKIKTSEFELSSTADNNIGFIKTLYGTLSDLKFGGDATYDGTSSVVFDSPTNGQINNLGIVGSVSGTIANVTNWAPFTVSATDKNGSDEINYVRMGGIAGLAEGTAVSIIGCTNKAGINNSALSNGIDATGFGTGGVLGYCRTGLTSLTVSGCVNEGTVENHAESINEIYLGGVIGYLHSTGNITECENRGAVKNYGTSTLGTGDGIYNIRIGGVLGSVAGSGYTITKCTNSGTVETYKDGTEFSLPTMGGIIGSVIGTDTTIAGCTNSGKVAPKVDITHVTCLGGIVGYCNKTGLKITKASDGTRTSNTAAFDFTGSLSGGYVAGIAAYLNVADATTIAVEYSDNSGNITVSGAQNAGIFMGGIVGLSKRTNEKIQHCQNSGKIYPSGTTFIGKVYFGGIAGETSGASAVINDCQNLAAGVVETASASACSTTAYFGGIVGYATGANTQITNCSNAALIQPNGNLAATYMGGIVGYLSGTSSAISSCTNSGNVMTTTNVDSDSEILMGGIAGISKSSIQNCTNSGTLYATGKKGGSNENKNPYSVGGIVGGKSTIHPSVISNCCNSGQIGIGKGAKSSCAGGISGIFSPGDTEMTSCTNTGYICVTRTNKLSYGGLIGICLVDTCKADTTICEGCKVDCDFEVPCTCNGGMVIGQFNGEDKYVLSIGSGLNPVKVKGTYTASTGYDNSFTTGFTVAKTTLNDDDTSEAYFVNYLSGFNNPHSAYAYNLTVDANVVEHVKNSKRVFHAVYGD